MSGGRGQCLAVPRRVEYGARRVVDVAAGGARQEGLPAGPLGGEHEVVQLDLPRGRGGADHERTADLAAVAAVVRSEAHGEEVALLDPAVGGPVPGAAGVGAGTDGGGEGGAVRPVVDQAALQLQREVAFGAADEDRLQQLAEGLVGDLGGDAQAGDLLLVLDQALLFHGEPEVRQAQLRRDGVQGAVTADGDVVLLDREGLGPYRGGQIGGRHGGIPARGVQHGDPQPFVQAALVVLAGRRAPAEQHLLRRTDQQDGARRGGSREVADVRRTRDQRGGVARGGAAVAKQGPTGRVHV